MPVVQDRANRDLRPKRAQTQKPAMRFNEPEGSIGADHWMETSSDFEPNTDAATMLMSPPPEEILRVSFFHRASVDCSPSIPQSARGKHASNARLPADGFMLDSSSPAQPSPSTRLAKRKRTRSFALNGHPDDERDGPFASTSQLALDTTPRPKTRRLSSRQVSFAREPTTPTRPKPKSRGTPSPLKRNALQSPHATNPNADFILPGPSDTREQLIARRRTITPVPYEPPAVMFTPPREVTYTPVPTISKSSKRKTLPRPSFGRAKQLILQIKKEPPEIDLSEPMPPASPSDDPLLLHGPPRSHHKRRQRRSANTQTPIYARDTPSIASSSPIRMPQGGQQQLMDANLSGLDMGSGDGADAFDDEGPIPLALNFDLADGVADWSDDQDDEEAFDHTGEYTGKYKAFLVPTKADPPSSCTKARMDAWGRPVSPFPRSSSPIAEGSGAAGPTGWSSSPVPEPATQPVRALPAIVGPPRSAEPVITDTPAGGFDDRRSESLPPSSPIPDSDDTVMPHAPDAWRETAPLISDDHPDDHVRDLREDDDENAPSEATPDLPIAESEDDVEGPPETPMTDFQGTPSGPVSDTPTPHSSQVARSAPREPTPERDGSASLATEEHLLQVNTPTPRSRLASRREVEEIQPALTSDFTPVPASKSAGPSYLGADPSPNPFAPPSDFEPRRVFDSDDDQDARMPSSSGMVVSYENTPVVHVEPPSEEQLYEEIQPALTTDFTPVPASKSAGPSYLGADPSPNPFAPSSDGYVHERRPVFDSDDDQAARMPSSPGMVVSYENTPLVHVEPPSEEQLHEEYEQPPEEFQKPTEEDERPHEEYEQPIAEYEQPVDEERPFEEEERPFTEGERPFGYAYHQEYQQQPEQQSHDEHMQDAEYYDEELPPSDPPVYSDEMEQQEEQEDVDTVFRELSQEPDYEDDDDDMEDPAVAGLPPPTRAISEMIPQSSPHNPFRVYSPHREVDEGIQTDIPSPPRAETSTPFVAAAPEESFAESSTARRGPPRQWPPTPAAADTTTSIDVLLPPTPRVAVEGEQDDDDYDEDPSVVIITSADPRAAARAAAILKLVRVIFLRDRRLLT